MGPTGRTTRADTGGRSGGSAGRTIDPSITSSRTSRGSSANSGAGRSGPDPRREAGPDYTNRDPGTPAEPVKVQSGRKITRISEP